MCLFAVHFFLSVYYRLNESKLFQVITYQEFFSAVQDSGYTKSFDII